MTGEQTGSALVTGGAGFIGRALVRRLLASGHEVTVLDTRTAWGLPSDPRVRVVTMDVGDSERLAAVVTGHDLVFHLAGNTENRPGSSSACEHYEVTLGGTVTLLDALAADPPRAVVLASTQLVYGGEAGHVTESAPLRPATAFAAAKAAAEAFLSAYAARTRGGAVAGRLANVVGPGVPRGVVADLAARLAVAPSHLEVLGDGRQRRSYVHVDDCARALLLAASTASRGLGSLVLNVANVDSLTIAEVAGIVAECSPSGAPRIGFAGGAAWQGDATELRPDPQRLLAAGWRPVFSSAQAVRSAAVSLFSPAPPLAPRGVQG